MMTEQQAPQLGVHRHKKGRRYLVVGVGEIDYEVSDYSNQGMSSIGFGHYSEDPMVRAEIRVRISEEPGVPLRIQLLGNPSSVKPAAGRYVIYFALYSDPSGGSVSRLFFREETEFMPEGRFIPEGVAIPDHPAD